MNIDEMKIDKNEVVSVNTGDINPDNKNNLKIKDNNLADLTSNNELIDNKILNLEMLKGLNLESQLNLLSKYLFKEDMVLKFKMLVENQVSFTAYFNQVNLDDKQSEFSSMLNPYIQSAPSESGKKFGIIMVCKVNKSREFVTRFKEAKEMNEKINIIYDFLITSQAKPVLAVNWRSFLRDEFSGLRSKISLGNNGDNKNATPNISKEYILNFFNKCSPQVLDSSASLKARFSHKKNIILVFRGYASTGRVVQAEVNLAKKRMTTIKQFICDETIDMQTRFMNIVMSIDEFVNVSIGDYMGPRMEVTDEVKHILDKVILDKHEEIETQYFCEIKELLKDYDSKDKAEYIAFWDTYYKNNKDVLTYGDIKNFNKFKKYKIDNTCRDITAKSELITVKFKKDYKDLNDFSVEYKNNMIEKISKTKDFIKNINNSLELYLEVEKYFNEKKERAVKHFSKNDFYRFRSFYNAEKIMDNETIKYIPSKNNVIICDEKIELTSIDKLKKHIDNIIKNTKANINNEFNSTIEDMLKVSEVEEYRNIVSVVDECPDKGITTYVDILKGSKNAKIRENSYDKLTAYSSLKSMKKSEIEECIEELMRGGVINTKYLKASFGRYWGLYVAGKYDSFISATTAILPENKMTQAYIKSLETTNIQDRIGAKKVVRTVKVSKVDTLDELIEELIDETSVLKSKALIKSARDNIKSFDKSKLNDLLEFIKDNRNAYKEVEEEFIKFLISIIDISLLPIFILQENMVNGVTKEFLSKLVIGLKEKSPNQTLA